MRTPEVPYEGGGEPLRQSEEKQRCCHVNGEFQDFHLAQICSCDFPLLVLKGLYHYWTYFFVPGDLSKWRKIVHGQRGRKRLDIACQLLAILETIGYGLQAEESESSGVQSWMN